MAKKLLIKDGKLVVKDGKLVVTSDPANCECCRTCTCCIDGIEPAGYRLTVTGVADDGCGANCANWNGTFDLFPIPGGDFGCTLYGIDLSDALDPICGPAPSIEFHVDCGEYTLFNLDFKSGELFALAQAQYFPTFDDIQIPADCLANMVLTGFFQVGAMGCDFDGASVTVEAI